MNKYFLVLFVFIIGCLIMISCSDDDNSINAVNKAPECSIIIPAINSSYTIGDTIFVAVEAEDEDGSIKEIRFYFDSIGVGYDSTFPYSCDILTNLYQNGAHFIRAVAEDNDGKEADTQISINLLGIAPVCLITSPANNATYTIGDSISVSVEATDADGNILEVYFYFDETEVGSDNTFPYSFKIPTVSYTGSTHTVKAIARDNDGIETSDQIFINLSNDPPEFTNGLMVDLAQNPLNNPDGIESVKSFTARSYVECLYQYGNTYTFSAETTSGDKWTVKIRWDGTDSDSIVYISDNSLNKIEMSSAEYGNYYINFSSGNAGQTYIKVLRLVPEEIIEAKFEGYIYEQGTSSDPDTLKNGYLITSKFVLSK